jgi:uncharacterized protein with beta-barrel porin domain
MLLVVLGVILLLWPREGCTANVRRANLTDHIWNNPSSWDSDPLLPGSADTVILGNSLGGSYVLVLDGDAGPIGNLTVQNIDDWGITGNGTANTLEIGANGSGLLKVTLGAGSVPSLPNNGTFTIKDGAIVVVNGNTLVSAGTLALARATLNSTTVTVEEDGILDLSAGNNALSGTNLTVYGRYYDGVTSTVALGTAAFYGSENYIRGSFTALSMELGSNALVTVETNDFLPGALTLNNGSGVITDPNAGVTTLDATGQTLVLTSIDMGDNTRLTANNLTVNDTYRDATGSTVDVTGTATFNGPTATITAGSNGAGGSFTAQNMTLGSNALVTVASDADFSIGTIIVPGVLTLNSGSGINLDPNGGFTMLNAPWQDLTLASIVMGDNTSLIAGNITTDVIDLTYDVNNADNYNIITANNLTINDSYRDATGSTVEVLGTATFNGPTATITAGSNGAVGSFTAQNMTLGSNARVDVATDAAFSIGTIVPGVLTLISGSGDNFDPNAGVTTLYAAGQNLALSSIDMRNNTSLTAGNIITDVVNMGDNTSLFADHLTVNGLYRDSASSTIDLNNGNFTLQDGSILGNFSHVGLASFYGDVTIARPGVLPNPTNHGTPSFISNGLYVGPQGTLTLADHTFVRSRSNSWIDGNLKIGAYSGLHVDGSLTMGNNAGVSVDLNRSQISPALKVNGELVFNNNALTLHHTGTTAQSGTWTLVEADSYRDGSADNGGFARVISTASVQGSVSRDANNIIVFATYTPMSTGNLLTLAAAPNARRSAAGFADLFNNRRTPFMHALNDAYNNMDALEADIARNLQGMTAEGPINHAAQTLNSHLDITNTAMGYAFGHKAPLSAQGFVPNLQATLMQMSDHANPFQAQQRRGIMAARQRISPAGPNGLPAQQHYSVLGNWQPATPQARQLVANATPQAALAGMAAGSAGIPGVNVWGGYVGHAVHQAKKDGYAGYNASHHGFLIGGSVDVDPALTVGLYGGWTFGQSSAKGIKSDIDSNAIHLGGFARFNGQDELQGLHVTGDLAYSTYKNESSRTVPLAIGNQKMDAKYGQYMISGGMEVAYDIVPPGDASSRITPFVAGRYSHIQQDSYTEDGPLALKVGKIEKDQFSTTVGLRGARDFVVADDSVVITPRASAAWLRNWGDERLSARSNFVGSPVSFTTRSTAQDSDAAQLGAGLDLRFKQAAGWDFGIKAAYGLDLRASSTGHNFFGGFEVNF